MFLIAFIGYLSRLLRLPSLAPDIVTALINGKHPPELSAGRIVWEFDVDNKQATQVL